MSDKYNVLINGASGFVGLELIKLLSNHKFINLKYLCSRGSIGKSINSFLKNKIKKKLPLISDINKADFNDVDIIFSALPHGEAQLLSNNISPHHILIDLSAAVYGLSEFAKRDIEKSNIISCPGCYPTSVQLALIPLLLNKIIKTSKIIIDSKSGYSGAGKKTADKKLYPNINKNIAVYGVGNHRHMPEIDQGLKLFAKVKGNLKIEFTPHLIPTFRGILTTIYADLNKNMSVKKIHQYLSKFYKNNNFVKILPYGKFVNTNNVNNTNNCNINIFSGRYKNQLIIVSSIDNLIKGAAGQAVQNMNIRLGLKETLGLE
ncbi:MAG: N-acetyl-gamma-glutamyl-phosphate reductase [Candidatus Fonsibacter ubiquis]|nr:N-acetyl-gamma-glutamyl-phosphate reductase [Candidatus Fonsibacter ubiquis]